MNINDYIKEMQTIAEQSGITSTAEMNEVLTLALFKLLQSPALVDDFKKHKLEHHNEDDKTLGIMENDLFEKHFIIEKNYEVIKNKTTFTGDKDVQEVKKNSVKATEMAFLTAVQSSQSFNEFCENYSDFLTKTGKDNLNKFSYRSKVETTLM